MITTHNCTVDKLSTTKRWVTEDGWILANFFFACTDENAVEVQKYDKIENREEGQYPAFLVEQTWD